MPLQEPRIERMSSECGDLTLKLGELLQTSIFSDLTISCGDKIFKVHKNILYLQSSYFRRLLGGKFKEASESQKSLDLCDDDPDALRVLIHYLYNFVYDDSDHKGDDRMAFTVKVYALADKYDVKKLQELATLRLHKICSPNDLKDFVAAIYAVEQCSNPSDRTLWNVILPLIKENMTMLLTKTEFRQAVDEIPQLKFDLLALLDDSNNGGKGEQGGKRGPERRIVA